MKTFALAVLLAALAAVAPVAHAGKIGACGVRGGCPEVCRGQYGPQATGYCQDNEDYQRCICINVQAQVHPIGGQGPGSAQPKRY